MFLDEKMAILGVDDGNVQDGAWYYKIKNCLVEDLKKMPEDAENSPT